MCLLAFLSVAEILHSQCVCSKDICCTSHGLCCFHKYMCLFAFLSVAEILHVRCFCSKEICCTFNGLCCCFKCYGFLFLLKKNFHVWLLF